MLERWFIWICSAITLFAFLYLIGMAHIFLWTHMPDTWVKRLLLRDWRWHHRWRR